jgi:hypothetical protein
MPRNRGKGLTMRLRLIRSATLLLDVRGRRILVDPMLDDAGAQPPIENTPNPVRNPTVPLPVRAEEVVRGIDAVIVTHRHRDHLDGTAERLLPRDVPVLCQPEDEAALHELGLDAQPVEDTLDWNGLRLVRTPARHGTGAIAELMAPVSGLVLDRPLPRGRLGAHGGAQPLPRRPRRAAGSLPGRARPRERRDARAPPRYRTRRDTSGVTARRGASASFRHPRDRRRHAGWTSAHSFASAQLSPTPTSTASGGSRG